MGVKVTVKTTKLKELQKKSRDLHGQSEVALPELMNDEFMRKYTDFQTLQAMFDASFVENAEEIGGDQFSKFIALNTRFGNWEEMLKTAGVEYGKLQLGL